MTSTQVLTSLVISRACPLASNAHDFLVRAAEDASPLPPLDPRADAEDTSIAAVKRARVTKRTEDLARDAPALEALRREFASVHPSWLSAPVSPISTLIATRIRLDMPLSTSHCPVRGIPCNGSAAHILS